MLIESVLTPVLQVRIAEARRAGVVSVPALVIDGAPFHINFGAKLSDLEGGSK